MSDPSLGLTMLGLIVVAIMMGFPTAFTLMGLGMIFGYIAFWIPGAHWYDNRAFDLIVQRAYGVMTNDALLSIPLFVFMGYIMERAALVDKMFHSVQLAFRRVPASLAVTTMLVSAFWGIASGIVGAVVVLMGVIAMGPMLKAGYDVRLASGTITAGGTLGILIPPSVMLIVYAAVAGQSIVKLYAAAMLPGFFLTGLYLVYILGWAIINPKIAPKLRPDQYRVTVPDYLRRLEGGRTGSVVPGLVAAAFRPALARVAGGYKVVANNLLAVFVPLLLTVGTLAGAWWYVVIYNAAPTTAAVTAAAAKPAPIVAPPAATAEQSQEVGMAGDPTTETDKQEGGEEVTSFRDTTASTAGRIPAHFYQWFWASAIVCGLLLLWYFWRMNGEQLEILKELIVSVVPLGVLTVVVLVVILFGICTATESAAIGALGALYLAVMARYPKAVWWWSLLGVVVGVALGWYEGEDVASLVVAASIGGTFTGTVIPGIWYLRKSPELRENLKQATFLTAKTTAMVCWLFVGSALFSAVFALHGGQSLIERWVLSMNLSPLGFQITAQLIIFLLGWPLEWTEIIVIFCPIFIPLLSHFHVDPILFGTMVAVNLQAAFLSPPVAMSAFYLKGVSPKHVTLNQIFAGMMPYMIIVCICLVFMYIWPGMTLWLPEFLYGK
ncbi:MAG: C4-dicarboxylate ABC transporter [Candidatus Rokubacteria bacterium 13_1_20CM_2_68_19]|nr:MAG: C4-dicarboxylate ABC transporter [Candidatus Rokubacteria bacterium 13_2_20CM_2_64_8]OLC58585.1 MAG: C4-dicarboxylate ABC transporter [Candidatus Rokubacteria bacterium 13_1_40CM_4_67_11]OLD33408.1 MAG: C4-dicarboxylate ABC transporter [Candidatus Rokubacteria bacterium 13_1_40CM_2_68_13]OLE44024.1 MAG: C4-dicarboxylate ABC transporter [Candidatus Rokubacteria bacterium 13_1_20CM_2_68_19]PYN68802.1 MAG: C4-dicarboxylate ABC transporter [Candidatus Rokubacteria bacterium]